MHLGLVEIGCFHVSPSTAAISLAQQPAAVASFRLRPVVHRHAHSSLSAETPRPRLAGIRIRAQKRRAGDGNGDGDPLPASANSVLRLAWSKKPHNFPKERRHISSHLSKLIRVFDGLLHYVAGGNTRCLCGLAENAVAMASLIVDSASLNISHYARGDISRDTVHRTLGAYVQVFVQTADDTFNNTVSKETITSFLGALRGLASVAHILLQAALESLSHEHPKESLSKYAFNYDVKKMHHVYDRRMRELEDGIRNSPTEMHTCKILMPTICEGMEATEYFVVLMMARRKRTLEKTHGKVADSNS